MTLWFFMSYILVNIFRILTNLFETLIPFFRKTSVIATATLLVRLSLLRLSHLSCSSGCRTSDTSSITLWRVNIRTVHMDDMQTSSCSASDGASSPSGITSWYSSSSCYRLEDHIVILPRIRVLGPSSLPSSSWEWCSISGSWSLITHCALNQGLVLGYHTAGMMGQTIYVLCHRICNK